MWAQRILYVKILPGRSAYTELCQHGQKGTVLPSDTVIILWLATGIAFNWKANGLSQVTSSQDQTSTFR